MKTVFKLKKANGGFMVLTIVLLVSATVLSIATGIFFRSIGQITESGDSEAALKTWSVVNSCGEYALREMSSTTDTIGWSYSGNETLNVGSSTCYIYPVEITGSSTKIVKASSTISSFTKKIQIEVSTNTPSVVVTSWKEKADF